MKTDFNKMQDNFDSLKEELASKDQKITYLEDKVKTLNERIFTLENSQYSDKVLLSGTIVESSTPNEQSDAETAETENGSIEVVLTDAEYTDKVRSKLCELTGIKKEELTIDAIPHGNRALITVTDRKLRSRLFQSFRQKKPDDYYLNEHLPKYNYELLGKRTNPKKKSYSIVCTHLWVKFTLSDIVTLMVF